MPWMKWLVQDYTMESKFKKNFKVQVNKDKIKIEDRDYWQKNKYVFIG